MGENVQGLMNSSFGFFYFTVLSFELRRHTEKDHLQKWCTW